MTERTIFSIARSDVESTGRWLTMGALAYLSRLAVVGMFVWLGLSAFAATIAPHDDSDAPNGDRSGFAIRRDALTGCEYLETSKGAITPRLRADGSRVCR